METSEKLKYHSFQTNCFGDPEVCNNILQAKHQLEIIFDHHQEGLVLLDRKLQVLRINKTMARWVGQPPCGIVGKSCHQGLWTLPRPCTFCPVKKVLTDGAPVHDVEQALEIDGQKTFWSISYIPVLENGRVEMVIGRYKDTTEEKKFFEMQIRTEKLISLGMIVAGVAHEITNPLSGISGIAGNMISMSGRYGLNETGQTRIRSILDSATRAQAILTDLLNFSGPKQYTMKPVNVKALIEKALDSIHLKGFKKIGKYFQVEIEEEIDDLEIICDSEKILISLVNLIHNAVYSVIQKSRYKERSNEEYHGSIKIRMRKRSNRIVISIIDNGMGISKNDKNRIFDPFFTTKGPGEGTGLGLSISNKIIIEHKGSLLVDSSPDQTVFTIEFPVNPAREKSL